MKLRVDRVLGLVFFLGFCVYAFLEYEWFMKEREVATVAILEKMEVRDKIVTEKKVEEREIKEEVKTEKKEEKKEEEKQEKTEKEKTEIEKTKIERKYIQAATFRTEEAAKTEAKRLGEGFKVKKAEVNGKTVYQVISKEIDDEETLKKMENGLKKFKIKYIVRTVGK